MRIRWSVDDGYVGKSRPQYTNVDDDDLRALSTDDERIAFIEECIEDDFHQNIGWSIDEDLDFSELEGEDS